jgi:hypothetical protein
VLWDLLFASWSVVGLVLVSFDEKPFLNAAPAQMSATRWVR